MTPAYPVETTAYFALGCSFMVGGVLLGIGTIWHYSVREGVRPRLGPWFLMLLVDWALWALGMWCFYDKTFESHARMLSRATAGAIWVFWGIAGIAFSPNLGVVHRWIRSRLFAPRTTGSA